MSVRGSIRLVFPKNGGHSEKSSICVAAWVFATDGRVSALFCNLNFCSVRAPLSVELKIVHDKFDY